MENNAMAMTGTDRRPLGCKSSNFTSSVPPPLKLLTLSLLLQTNTYYDCWHIYLQTGNNDEKEFASQILFHKSSICSRRRRRSQRRRNSSKKGSKNGSLHHTSPTSTGSDFGFTGCVIKTKKALTTNTLAAKEIEIASLSLSLYVCVCVCVCVRERERGSHRVVERRWVWMVKVCEG